MWGWSPLRAALSSNRISRSQEHSHLNSFCCTNHWEASLPLPVRLCWWCKKKKLDSCSVKMGSSPLNTLSATTGNKCLSLATPLERARTINGLEFKICKEIDGNGWNMWRNELMAPGLSIILTPFNTKCWLSHVSPYRHYPSLLCIFTLPMASLWELFFFSFFNGKWN